MAIEKNFFGTMPDGKKTYLYLLKNTNGMKVGISTYGGTIVSLQIPNKNNELIDMALGYDSLKDYLNGNSFFGSLIGRFGNRIEYGKFTLNKKEYKLAQNDGNHHLHGGIKGFDKVVWNSTIADNKPNTLELSYLSIDGEEGYPGNLTAKVTYTLTEDNAIEINYSAVSDKDTIINLTNHTYFNLSGHSSGNVLNQKLMINADSFTVNDEFSIPTGEIKSVSGTPMDFRKLTPIGENINNDYEQIIFGKGYDHNWVLNTNGSDKKIAAQVIDENSGIAMEVYTTSPGIQFYSGNFLDGSDMGKNNIIYKYRNGFCLETQFFPNSINCSSFPSPLFKAGEEFQHRTIYKFSIFK